MERKLLVSSLTVSEYQPISEDDFVGLLTEFFLYTAGMLRASIIPMGIIFSATSVIASGGQSALSDLRDIIVPYKDCAQVALAKEVDPEGIIDRDIVKPSQQEIYRHWLPLIPESARPPSSKKGKAVIELRISMEGKIESIHLVSRSGDEAIAKSAWGAITASTFKPFPAKARAKSVTWTNLFTVNGEKCADEIGKAN